MVITDGKQTRDKADITPLAEAAQLLKDKGVVLYALGVSKYADLSDLKKIASSSETVVIAPSFKALGDVVITIRKNVCKGISKTIL